MCSQHTDRQSVSQALKTFGRWTAKVKGLYSYSAKRTAGVLLDSLLTGILFLCVWLSAVLVQLPPVWIRPISPQTSVCLLLFLSQEIALHVSTPPPPSCLGRIMGDGSENHSASAFFVFLVFVSGFLFSSGDQLENTCYILSFRPQWLSSLGWLWTSVPWWPACEFVSLVCSTLYAWTAQSAVSGFVESEVYTSLAVT